MQGATDDIILFRERKKHVLKSINHANPDSDSESRLSLIQRCCDNFFLIELNLNLTPNRISVGLLGLVFCFFNRYILIDYSPLLTCCSACRLFWSGGRFCFLLWNSESYLSFLMKYDP